MNLRNTTINWPIVPALLLIGLVACATPQPSERKQAAAEETPFNASLSAMGVALRANDFAEAEKQAKTAMALSRPADLGNKFYGIPFSYLASIYLRQSKYNEMETLHRQAMAFLGTLGPYDKRAKDAIFTIRGLGESFLVLGRHSEAGDIFKRIFKYRESVLGPVHIDVSHTLINLGDWHEREGRYGEAEKTFKRALTMKVELLGPEHPDLIYTLHWLTRLSRKQGRYAEADAYQGRALEIRDKAEKIDPLAGHGPREAARLTETGYAMRRAGAYVLSEFHFIRALKIREKLYGHEHPNVFLSQSDLATIYKLQGRYNRSERLYLQAGKVAEKTLGPDHPVLALILDNLAVLYLTQDRYAEAEPLVRRSLAIFEKARGPVHADVATSLNNLAGLYRSQEKFAEAEAVLKRSLAIYEKLYGQDHPNAGIVLSNLAQVYHRQGKTIAAEQAFKRASAKLEVPGVDEVTIAVNRYDLARLYIDLERYADAESLLDRAINTLTWDLDPGHPFVVEALTQYSRLLRSTGREAEAQKLDARLETIKP